ncbi:MAG: hypothetical protein IT450_14770 [Phycisphaerales bacterium]|nr:hypothetical protein [Phycisphaerales bacterium]
MTRRNEHRLWTALYLFGIAALLVVALSWGRIEAGDDAPVTGRRHTAASAFITTLVLYGTLAAWVIGFALHLRSGVKRSRGVA